RICAQEIVYPLDLPPRLNGNFGELRDDHFHSGLDLNTQSTIGHPVKAVKAGYISRISVSSSGFGRALYINHPDGTISVYGHLDHFAPKIESAVRDSEYVKESFSVNLNFSAGQFPVKQGEVVAYSGNKGSSGGPHLHFELRNTQTEKVFDPLPAFKNRIKDRRPPEIRGLAFYPQQGKGIINGSVNKQIINVIRSKGGKYALAKPVKAWGTIGIGIKAYDKMDAAPNVYGVKEIRLLVNNTEVYHSVMDGFFFNESRYINSFIDWDEWKTRKSFFMKSFIEPGNKLGIYRNHSNGLISIQESKTYHCEYILKDAFGNTSTLAFIITGEKRPIPAGNKRGILFSYNKDNEYKGKGMTLTVPQGNLYTDVYLNPDATPADYSVFAPAYSFGVRAPLHSSCPLTLTITDDSYPDKSKYGIVSINNDKKIWLGGDYESHQIKTKIRELGKFTVAIDTIPPDVVPQYPDKWAMNERITFRISDDLSGIDFYQGRLDGKFALFEYDAKTNSLFCNYDEKRMKRGKQNLTLVVRDGAKNETRVSYEVEL
ncbi:MAG: M23 family metallopeptidase, partial [Oscillospiraceae bacterium]|nr:M23 family metallopeptidase [Oscillospiraceae bacterium]